MKAEILCIGTELLLGDIVAVMILAKRGVEVTEDLWFGHANLE